MAHFLGQSGSLNYRGGAKVTVVFLGVLVQRLSKNYAPEILTSMIELDYKALRRLQKYGIFMIG